MCTDSSTSDFASEQAAACPALCCHVARQHTHSKAQVGLDERNPPFHFLA